MVSASVEACACLAKVAFWLPKSKCLACGVSLLSWRLVSGQEEEEPRLSCYRMGHTLSLGLNSFNVIIYTG